MIFDFWLINYSGIPIVEYLTIQWPSELDDESPPLKLYILFLLALIIYVLIKAINEFIVNFTEAGILQITFFGFKIALMQNLFYQAIVQFFIGRGSSLVIIYFYFKSLIVTTISMGVLSFFIAYQRKTKNNWMLALYVLLFLLFFKWLTTLLSEIIVKNF